MTAPQSPRSPDTAPHWTDLKVSRVAAAALAAVTSALLGSRLGAEGTLIGAAGASVVTTVATSVYQTSLERSRERVRSMAHRPRSRPSVANTVDTLPADQGLGDDAEQPPDRSRRSTMWRWGGAVAGALGGFVLAMMMITGIEWASGETVGDNGKGTTIGQVVNSGPQQPSSPRHEAPPSQTPTETPTETSEPPATSTTTPEPSPTETPTTRPSPSQTTVPPLIPPLPRIGG